ncbi:YlbF family regulator [Lactobacillus terrae]|uniref:YlbF family regulator n=1 Tax=Lactobacillus terrae TaxID=2269374 RepID=UPI000C1B76C7|nr:YlbF family regulator [Lactobacillus terrae]
MNNIYDSANALEQDLRKATEVVELKEAFEAVKNNEVAFKLFDKVQNKQFELQQKQVMGQDVSDEDIESMKQLTDQLQNFDEFKTLMEKEQKMNAMMEELNKIITKPIADIYQSK